MGRNHLERAREVLARAKENAQILNPHTNGNGKVREEHIPGIPLYSAPAEPIEAAKKCELIGDGGDLQLPPWYVTDVLRLREAIAEISASSKVGLDLETTGLRWWEDRIRLVSITAESGKTWVIDAFEVEISALFDALKDAEIVAHNAVFDVLFLKGEGFEPGRFVCTKILSQILWAGKLKKGSDKNVDHDLASVARRALGEKLDKTAQNADWTGEITPAMLDYAAKDSAILLPLHDALKRRLDEAGLDRVVDLEKRFLEVVAHISRNGLPVDEEKWAAYIEAVEA